MLITPEKARSFAEHWIEAWNSHDLEKVLSHYSDDFSMSSPFIAQMGLSPDGTLRGKPAVAAYWAKALERLPDLRFKLLEVFCGGQSVVIRYEAVLGKLGAEVFFFGPDGLVERAAAHYL